MRVKDLVVRIKDDLVLRANQIIRISIEAGLFEMTYMEDEVPGVAKRSTIKCSVSDVEFLCPWADEEVKTNVFGEEIKKVHCIRDCYYDT